MKPKTLEALEGIAEKTQSGACGLDVWESQNLGDGNASGVELKPDSAAALLYRIAMELRALIAAERESEAGAWEKVGEIAVQSFELVDLIEAELNQVSRYNRTIEKVSGRMMDYTTRLYKTIEPLKALAATAKDEGGWIKIEPGCEMPSDCELVQLTVVYNKPRPHNKPETWCGYSATGDSNDPQWTECDGTRFDDPHPDDPDWDYRAVAWKPLSEPWKPPSKETGGDHE